MDASLRKRFDEAIVAEYVIVDTPSDQIVQDTELASSFAQRVNARLDLKFDQKQIAHRLVTLRKMCKLPRLRRQG